LAKIRRKIAKKRLFFTKNAFFLHFFAKKNTRGYDPFFCKFSRDPASHSPHEKPLFFASNFCFESFRRKKTKSKIKKIFFLFFIYALKYFFKKKIFLRKVSLRRVIYFVKHLGQFSPRIVQSDIRSSPKGQRPFIHHIIFTFLLLLSVCLHSRVAWMDDNHQSNINCKNNMMNAHRAYSR
jgi:hypothetical protein